MFLTDSGVMPPCRTYSVPPCDLDASVAANATVEALHLFQLRLRDTLDFTVDFGAWLRQNSATISDAVFTVASGSPKTPLIQGQGFAAGKCVVTLKAATSPAAVVSDAYWLDLTVTFAAVTATDTTPAIPARTIVRRLHFVVANG